MGKRNSKRPYRAVPLTKLDQDVTREGVRQQRIIVGIDIAKKGMVAVVLDEGEGVVDTVKWEHPEQTEEFIRFVSGLMETAASVEIAMEPTGVYGDALRATLIDAGFRVFRVSPKKTHDMSEVHDGVPSTHDGKSAVIVATLHFYGKSDEWPMDTDEARRLAAALTRLGIVAKDFERCRNRLEAQTARYWPEVTHELDLDSATLLRLLERYGGPAPIAADAKAARELARRVGGSKLDPEKVVRVVASASTTVGVKQIEEERELMRFLAGEALRCRRLKQVAQHRVEELAVSSTATEQLAPVTGKTTAAVIAVGLGDPLDFDSPQAMVKAAGLNLRVHSSGSSKQGGLHITKRGHGVVRLYLWMLALRFIKSNPVVRAWFAAKVKRDGGGSKAKAVVAVMRKVLMGLWHVARGARFDAAKLFDVRRLDIEVVSLDEAEGAL
jgi:transposase